MTGDLADLALGAGDALFLDFDGTLAEIVDDPDTVTLNEGTALTLARIAERLGGAVALLSGRDIRDLAGRTPGTLWRAGGHGLEVIAPGEVPPPAPAPPPEAVLIPLRSAALLAGVRLEIKGPVAALHYRAAPGAESVCLAAAAAAALRPGYVLQAGKMVVEVKPAEAHKGRTLSRLMATPPFAGRRPIMIGDDATDEDAMAAAQDLGGVAVKVGAGDTVAQLRSPNPAAVRDWLARLAA